MNKSSVQPRKQSESSMIAHSMGENLYQPYSRLGHNIHKELQKLNTKGRKLPINKCAKDLNRQFKEKKKVVKICEATLKGFNILLHQRNANENYFQMASHPGQNGCHRQTWWQVWRQCGENGTVTPCSWAALNMTIEEIKLEISPNTKNRNTYDPATTPIWFLSLPLHTIVSGKHCITWSTCETHSKFLKLPHTMALCLRPYSKELLLFDKKPISQWNIILTNAGSVAVFVNISLRSTW